MVDRATVPPLTFRPRLGLDDTPPEVRQRLIEGYRRMSPAEKMRRVAELNRAVRQMALAGLRARFPTASPRELELRLAARTIDPETMRRAFGWSPDRP